MISNYDGSDPLPIRCQSAANPLPIRC